MTSLTAQDVTNGNTFRFMTKLSVPKISSGAVSSTGGQASNANADLNTFILAGDINRDRSVNFDDLLILAQNYGQSGRTYSQGNVDYSADGVVGFDDLLVLAQRYGTSLVQSQPLVNSAKNRSVASEIL